MSFKNSVVELSEASRHVVVPGNCGRRQDDTGHRTPTAVSILAIALAGLIGGPACAASAGTNGSNSTGIIGGAGGAGGVGGTSGEVQGIPVGRGGDGGAGGASGAGGTEAGGSGGGGGGAVNLGDGVGGAGGNGGADVPAGSGLGFGGGGGGAGGFGSVDGGAGALGGAGGAPGDHGVGLGGPGGGGGTGANGRGGAGGDGSGGGVPGSGTGGGAGGGGAGGAGGGGLLWTGAAGHSYENTGTLVGGKGGHGASTSSGAGGIPGGSAGGGGGAGGAGGDGGAGVVITATGVTFTNAGSGVVRGGDGGSGGSGGSGGAGTNGNTNGSRGADGEGGNGGAGLIGSAGWVINHGSITGGHGAGANGKGGAGIIGSGLSITNSGTISGGLNGSSGQADAIDFVGGANTLMLQDGSILSGNVGIGGNGSLTLDQSSAQTLGNVITGNGSVIQNGSGTLILNGINTYTGGTTVQSGTLEVGDAAHPLASVQGGVQVNAAGTLRGHGTVGGDVNNQGIVWPGGSIGTLTIAGNYTQSPTSTLMIDVSPTAASQLRVGGTASLDGTLDLLYGPGTYTPKDYTIVSAGSVSGKFATVSGNAPTGFAQNLVYSPDTVTLDLAANPAAVLPPGTTVVVLPSGAKAFVVAPVNATIFGDLGSAALREAQRVNGALLDRLGRTCWFAADTACTQPGRRLWMQASGTFSRIDGNRGAPDVRDDRYGFLAGADRALGAWTVGLAGGYSHGDIREDPDAASGKIDTLRLAVYGGRRLGVFDIAGTAGYAYDFFSAQRRFGWLGRTHGTGHAQEFNAGLQVSLPWTFRATENGAWTLTPHLGLRYAHVDGFGLSESGLSSQRLSVGDQRLNSLQPYAGLTLDYAFTMHGSARPAHVGLQVGYAYETQHRDHDVSVTSADGTGFVVPGTRDTRGLTTAGLSVDVPLGRAASLYARYDAVLPTGNVRAQAVQAGVRYRF